MDQSLDAYFLGYFGDQRRSKAVSDLYQKMVETQGIHLKVLATDRAEQVRFQRCLANPHVTCEEMVLHASDHLARTACGRHVVAIQDTTTVRHEAAHLQRLRLGSEVGVLLHPTVALDADTGDCLGVCDVQVLRRVKKVTARAKRSPAARESRRWTQGMVRAQEVLQTATHITHVFDAEGDTYEVLSQGREPHEDLVVRAGQDRRTAADATLFAHLDTVAEAFCYTTTVTVADANRGKRRVPVVIRFAPVEILRPQSAAARTPASVVLQAVDVREIGAADPDTMIHWRLLTTRAVRSVEDALEVVRLYALRWEIEQIFRLLKTEGLDIGSCQMTDSRILAKHATLAMIASVRLAELIKARDDDQGRPASDLFDAGEVEVLAALQATLQGKTDKQKNPFPPSRLSWAAWTIARLGGWKGYVSERKPGPKTFSRGLRRFSSIAQGFRLSRDLCIP
jgi:hypothetical protein